MLILAIDQSTASGSLALLQEERVLGELGWRESRGTSQHLLACLPELLDQAAVRLAEVEAYAVGLGPGSYTGLRIAVAAALGLALPDHRPVYGISSAEALAASFLAESGLGSVMVIGDARRHQLWARLYTRQGGMCVAGSPWLLRGPEALADLQAAAWITPDWSRIGTLLQAQAPTACRLVAEQLAPTAAAVGLAAHRRISAGMSAEPPVPIYLHAAVAVRETQACGR